MSHGRQRVKTWDILTFPAMVPNKPMTTTAATAAIDVLTCTTAHLASYLLKYRFRDDAHDVASFLLECTSMLPDADRITTRLLRGDDDDDDDDDIMTNDGDNDGDNDVVIGNADGSIKKGDHYSENEKMEDENFSRPRGKMMTSSTAVPSSAGCGNNGSSRSSIEKLPPSSIPILRDYECEVSCINPRGRFLLRIYRHGIVLTDPKKIQDDCKITVDSRQVEHVIIFRKPEEYKKFKSSGGGGGKRGLLAGGHMVLINLKEDDETLVGIEYKGKRLGQICFQLPSYGATAITAANDDDNDDDDKLIRLSPTESQWKAGLLSALGKNNTIDDNNNNNNNIIWVHSKMDNEQDEGNNSSHHHSRYIFHSTTLEGTTNSSSTTEGLPYVGCYKGFNDGALFPLREGLLFFKPPLFVHRSKLVSISCGRGSVGGGGSSRYVDMIATLDDDDGDDDVETNKSATKTKKKKKKKKETILEFTNINRDELTGLNDYIHKVLIPAMKSDCENDVDDVTGDNDKNTEIDANSDEDDVYIDDDEDVAVATVVVGDDNNEGWQQSEAQCATKKRPIRAAAKEARMVNRTTLLVEKEEDDDDDSDEFSEMDDSDDDDNSSDDDDDDSESHSDGEFSDDGDEQLLKEGKDFDDEEADDSNGSSDCNDRKKKIARTE